MPALPRTTTADLIVLTMDQSPTMTHTKSADCRLATYPSKLLLLTAIALVAYSRIAVVLASTQRNSSVSDDSERSDEIAAINVSPLGVVHTHINRPSSTQSDLSVGDNPARSEEIAAVNASAHGVVLSQVKRHSPTQTKSSLGRDPTRDEERGPSMMNFIKPLVNFGDAGNPRLSRYENALVDMLSHAHDIHQFSSSHFDNSKFYKLSENIISEHSSRKRAIGLIFHAFHLKKSEPDRHILTQLVDRLEHYKKQPDQEMAVKSRRNPKTMWKLATFAGKSKADVEAAASIRKKTIVLELAPHLFSYWCHTETPSSVYTLLRVDATSKTFFDDPNFLVWIDFLVFGKDRLNIDPYEVVLQKLQTAFKYDDAELAKKLLVKNADTEPGTIAAHVMEALFSYWDTHDVELVALLPQLVPSLDTTFLDGPLRIWLRYVDFRLKNKLFPTVVQAIVPPVRLPSRGGTKSTGSIKSQLKGVNLDVNEALPSDVRFDDLELPLIAVESQPDGVTLRDGNDGLWQPYDYVQPLLDRYEPLPSDARFTPFVVPPEPNLLQRDVVKEKALVDILAEAWLTDDSIEVTPKLTRTEKIFEALCESWSKHAMSPVDILEFLQIADLEGNHLLESPHLRTWMTYMSNTDRLSSVYNVLKSRLNDKELSMLVAKAMDWKTSFRQAWFLPLFNKWNSEGKSARDVYELLELDIGPEFESDSPLMIVFYHYVVLAGNDRVKQTLLLRAMLEQKYENANNLITFAYLESKGVLKQVYFELLATLWLNEGLKSPPIFKYNKYFKSQYDRMRKHPSKKAAVARNMKVRVPKEFKL